MLASFEIRLSQPQRHGTPPDLPRSATPPFPLWRSPPRSLHTSFTALPLQLCTFAQRATCSIVNTMPTSAKVARVAIDDGEWHRFRQAALAQRISVSAYLGRLVEAELSRRRGRPVAAIDPEGPPVDQAVAALAEVRASIDELEGVAGRLARSAVAHGGSWKDVATSLRITEEQARSYQRQRNA